MQPVREAARVDTLIVVAAHGPDYIDACLASLGAHPRLVVDTGSGTVPGADVRLHGGHPTGAYRWAYEHTDAAAFLFVQDSMVAVVPDPVAWFVGQAPELGAVAWGRFPLAWDNVEQRGRVEAQYGADDPPDTGIFGPVFWTTRAALEVLGGCGLLPPAPADRMQAQGTERAWAYAYRRAGLAVTGPMWDSDAMGTPAGFGPFRKTWAARP